MSVRYLTAPFLFALSACASMTPEESVAVSPAMAASPQAFLDTCEDWDDWDKPAPPFRIHGATFYVGTCGISAILVTGEEGHILIDTGVEAAVPEVLSNIRELGFDPKDIRYILMSHEHFDHVGGHAAMAEATGAQVIASQAAAPVLESGTVATDDPQHGAGHPRMTPVKVSRIVADGDIVTLGNLGVVAHTTPGHTPGALSWSWWTCSLPGEPPVCSRVAYIDSLSAVSADDYRFIDHPDAVRAFRASVDKVRMLSCDYLVTPHPSASSMLERLATEDGLLVDSGCTGYADAADKKLDERLAREAGT